MKLRSVSVTIRRTLVLLAAGLFLLPTACGRKNHWKPVYPVTGKLLCQGKPASRAILILHPVDDREARPLRPAANVAADGSFHVSTYVKDDGAPPGEYAVTVTWPMAAENAPPEDNEGPDWLQGRCNDPKTSPWRIRVEKQPGDAGTFDLSSWPGMVTR